LNSDKNIIKEFLNSSLFYFYKLENLINEIKTYSFYSEDYMDLINILSEFNEIVTNNFRELKSKIIEKIKTSSPIEIYNENVVQLNRFNLFLKYFNQIISIFINAENFYIHQGIFILIENFTKKISKISRFIIYPFFPSSKSGMRLNYAYKNLLDFFRKFDKEVEKPEIEDFLLFSIPTLNKEDLLSSCLLGHEIGHFINEKNQIGRNITSEKFMDYQSIFRTNYNKWIKELQAKKPTLKFDLHMESVFFKIWFRIISNWIKEIICDKIGLKLFGLSFFFAFLDFIYINNPYNKGTEKHPPNWLRLKILIDEIQDKDGEISKFIKNYKIDQDFIGEKIKNIISFVQKNFTEEKQEKDEIIQKMKEKVEIAIVRESAIKELNNRKFYHKYINSKLDECIKEYCYKFKIDDMNDVIKLLDLYIIPNEIIDFKKKNSKAVNIITILNAGWLYFLFKIKNHYNILKNLNKMEVRKRFNELLLKAIELSNIQQKIDKILKKAIIKRIFEIFGENNKKEIGLSDLIKELKLEKNFYRQAIEESICELIRKRKLINIRENFIINLNFIIIQKLNVLKSSI